MVDDLKFGEINQDFENDFCGIILLYLYWKYFGLIWFQAKYMHTSTGQQYPKPDKMDFFP